MLPKFLNHNFLTNCLFVIVYRFAFCLTVSAIMKELIIHPGCRTEIIESAIPSPDALQVVIKVIVSGTNPKDWKVSQC